MTNLTVQSMRRYGVGTGASDFISNIGGKLGSLTVKGDIIGGRAFGNILLAVRNEAVRSEVAKLAKSFG
jgi:hypothetical protein